MATAWVYVINDGGGTPNVVRRSHSATTVEQVQAGEYVVTFPSYVRYLACVATLNNSVGTITAIPGDVSGLLPNQARVVTLTLGNELRGSYDFSLAVFYRPWWWIWTRVGRSPAGSRDFRPPA
ncbi:MAG TPA: hypothetical protein VFG78_07150 [Gemmatimonadota bacterium]|nr:hypothetical protein [Gemmatimonadota bacterium]